MTAPYVPGTPPQPTGFIQTAPPQPSRRGLVIAAVITGVVLIVGLVIALAAASSDKPAASGADDTNGQPFAPPAGVTAAPAPTPTPTVGPSPAVADFKLTPKIMDKECFGSAGCNITFRVNLAYSGPALDTADTWLVTYEVAGIEDAPMVGTLELTGTTFESSEETVSTTSSKKKLTLKVTAVEKDGI